MSRQTGFPPETAAAMLDRDGNRCSMEGFTGCPGQAKAASDPGHRLNRGSGGDPRWFINDPANGTSQHHGCNWKLEQVSEFAEEGRRRGCKLDHSGDDEATILGTPMWSPFWSQWLILRAEGAFLSGDTEAWHDARTANVIGSVEDGFGIVWDDVPAVDNPAIHATGVRG